MRKALLVMDMQEITVGRNHAPQFNYPADLIEKVNAVILENTYKPYSEDEKAELKIPAEEAGRDIRSRILYHADKKMPGSDVSDAGGKEVKCRLDLWNACRAGLLETGVKNENIFTAGISHVEVKPRIHRLSE